MAKKYYKKAAPKKKTKEIPVCAECLLDPTDSDLKPNDFFWVLKHDPEHPLMDHYALFCINCIDKEGYVAAKPYQKKRGRKKKED